MRKLIKREIERRYPKIKRCNCGSCPTPEQIAFAKVAKGYQFVGKLVELTTTNDRIEELGAWRFMNPVRPPIDGDREAWLAWKVHDSSRDKTTVWCRDVFLCVEVRHE